MFTPNGFVPYFLAVYISMLIRLNLLDIFMSHNSLVLAHIRAFFINLRTSNIIAVISWPPPLILWIGRKKNSFIFQFLYSKFYIRLLVIERHVSQPGQQYRIVNGQQVTG